jgi:hypothetical protein
VRVTGREWRKMKSRNLLWLESLWEGTATTAKEEERKVEVFAVFRGLVSDFRSQGRVHEYVPWQPLW